MLPRIDDRYDTWSGALIKLVGFDVGRASYDLLTVIRDSMTYRKNVISVYSNRGARSCPRPRCPHVSSVKIISPSHLQELRIHPKRVVRPQNLLNLHRRTQLLRKLRPGRIIPRTGPGVPILGKRDVLGVVLALRPDGPAGRVDDLTEVDALEDDAREAAPRPPQIVHAGGHVGTLNARHAAPVDHVPPVVGQLPPACRNPARAADGFGDAQRAVLEPGAGAHAEDEVGGA